MTRFIGPVLGAAAVLGLAGCAGMASPSAPPALPETGAIDAFVENLRVRENVPGIALAVIDGGEIRYIETYGDRRLEPEEKLDADTVMYGASLTKFVFATYVMQLVDDGVMDLDTPIGAYFEKPLPEYEEWADLAGDERWRDLTLRLILSHQTGWANYRFFPPGEGGFDAEGKLKFYNDPGTRYGYSGEGYILAQRAVHEVLGVDPGDDMQARIFAPLSMTRTGMIWRDEFAPNYAVGYTVEGEAQGHNMQDNTRAAGSMDTTITDFAAFAASFMRGELLSDAARAEILSPQIAIVSKHKFPPLDPANDTRNAKINLAAGLGVVVWDAPGGTGFLKAGHNEKTDNMMVCLEAGKRCVVMLSNTAKGDRIYPQIIEYILGGTNFRWEWEYSALDTAE